MNRRMGTILLVLLLASTAAVGQPGVLCETDSWLESAMAPVPLFACPQGDGPSFIVQGWRIGVQVIDWTLHPVPNIPPVDIWLMDCDPVNDAILCGGSTSSNADSVTNSDGMTTMSLTPLIGGGCAQGMVVVVQGLAVLDETQGCAVYECLPVWVRSPDIDGSLGVDLVDLSIFASSFPPQPYDSCCDFDINGVVNLQDLSNFAAHFGPPGHQCF